MNLAIRTTTLDELGSLDAPPGTGPWAVAVRRDIQATLNDVQGSASHLRSMVELIRDYKGYLQLKNRRGQSFPTFEAFSREKPPYGLGYNSDDIDAIIHERSNRTTSEKTQTALPLETHGGERGQVESLNLNRGHTVDYYLARLARDVSEVNPDKADRRRKQKIREQIIAGEISANEGAIQAGYEPRKTKINLDNAASAARSIRARATPEFVRELATLLTQGD